MKRIPSLKEVDNLFESLKNAKLTIDSLTDLEKIIHIYEPRNPISAALFRLRLKGVMEEGAKMMKTDKKAKAFIKRYFVHPGKKNSQACIWLSDAQIEWHKNSTG